MPNSHTINGDEEPNLAALDEVAAEALLIVELARHAAVSPRGRTHEFDLDQLTPVEKRVLLALLWTENHLPPADSTRSH
jgi:hypothetical protein